MMRRTMLTLGLLLLAVAPYSSVGAEPARGGLRSTNILSPDTVTEWLVLGPVADPLPVFHDADRESGTSGQQDLRIDPTDVVPENGATVKWMPGSELRWRTVSARDGALDLSGPSPSVDAPASAWLAVYVEVDRFSEVEVTLEGTDSRSLWVGGARLTGASGTDAAEKTSKLTPGKHLFLIKTTRDPSEDEDWQVVLELSAPDEVNLRTSTDPMRSISITDITDPPRAGSVALSPDGELVALSMSRFKAHSDDRESWVEIRRAEDGNLIRSWKGVDVGQVDWAPRGRRISYVTSEGSGESRTSTLWLADLESGVTSALLEEVERFSGYRWLPHGEGVVYLTSVPPDKNETGIKRLEGVMDRWANFRTKQYLHLVTVPEGVRRRLTAGPLSTSITDVSPDGNKILFTRSVEDFQERHFSKTELWEMDLLTFEAESIMTFGWLNGVRYAPEGPQLLVAAGPLEFDGIGADVPDGMIANNYDTQLFLWNRSTDAVEAITKDFDPSVSTATWGADGNVYLTAQDEDRSRLFRYRTSSGQFEVLETGFDMFGSLQVARNAPAAVGTGTSPWEPQGVVYVDLRRDRHRVLVRPGEEHFSRVRTGTMEPWDFTATNGKTIRGRIYYPPGFDPEDTYPAIVYYYGGTSPVGRSFGGRYPKEYWASNGYIVYVLQPSGATGFGQEFSAAHVNDWGKTTVDEIVEGTRRFKEAHPFVDPDRVGNIGASYGGFMTMLLSTKTDEFAAAVAHAGISSLASYWGEGYWGYSYSSVATAGSFPWNRPDIYVDQSPLFRADQNTTPILLTHGDSDTNVPVGESDQFYIALKILGKDVEYLQVAGQNHWILDHAKRIRWSRSILAWFDRWLKGQPDWWNSLYPD